LERIVAAKGLKLGLKTLGLVQLRGKVFGKIVVSIVIVVLVVVFKFIRPVFKLCPKNASHLWLNRDDIRLGFGTGTD